MSTAQAVWALVAVVAATGLGLLILNVVFPPYDTDEAYRQRLEDEQRRKGYRE